MTLRPAQNRRRTVYGKSPPSPQSPQSLPPATAVTIAGARLAGAAADAHAGAMFTVTDAQAAAIRRVFVEQGELPAVIELRRHFPGITDPAKARECARIIAGWRPPPAVPRPVTRLPADRTK
jgi:hypothetical protein